MSREGSQQRIDSLLAGTGRENRYQRSALGNAVRFSTMINVLAENAERSRRGEVDPFRTRADLIDALDTKIRDITNEYNNSIAGYDSNDESRTVQQAMAESAYSTELGRTIAKETAFNASRTFQVNTGATEFSTSSSAKSFFGSFTRGDSDFFGSKVLFDNVFGPHIYGDYNTRLSRRDSLTRDEGEDYSITASQKVLYGITDRSLDNVEANVDRLDLEFSRFHGESLIDQYSLTGSGLRSARETIRRVQLGASGTAGERARIVASLSGNKTITDVTKAEFFEAVKEPTLSALQEINTLYQNRSSNQPPSEIVNKAGVQTFVELFNSADNRISIQAYQFQNDTISASLIDVIKRKVLERKLDPNNKQPFTVDFTVASPINRNNQVVHKDEKIASNATGDTTYSILGPNLIEVLKLQEIERQVMESLREEGIATDDISQFFRLNIQYRDRKYHPKLYMTDRMAAIGTQNLTGPVGNSINQAGSNFEQMYIVRDKYYDRTTELIADNSEPKSKYVLRSELEQANKDANIRSSLLFRQIQQLSDYERNMTDIGYQGYGLLQRRGQVGLSGDIYEHLRNTLDFTANYYTKLNNATVGAPGQDKLAGGAEFSMHFILDQAFMLQMSADAQSKQLKGEMGEDFAKNVYDKTDGRVTKYRELQDKLAYLLTVNRANVLVDAKNLKEQVYNPLLEKISKNAELEKKFNRYGRNLGILAGNAIFGPKTTSHEDYTTSQKTMMEYLKAQGFTEAAGFTDADLKQLIVLGTGNIKGAVVPRQHVKGFGLFMHENGTMQMKSFYTGSSNMGVYALGIPSGDVARPGDFASVNTEMGVMLGANFDYRDSDNNVRKANLSRTPRVANRPELSEISAHTADRAMNLTDYQADWSLNQEQEHAELQLMQERFVQTYKELGNSRISHPGFLQVKTTPLWQENVNAGDLQVLKQRLDKLKSDIGLGKDSSAFKVVERIEDGKLVSFNVTIDMARAFGEKGFMSASANMPKFNFEISVLNGPSRGSDMLEDRTGGVPGYVYFVDKNKVIGNGIFINDTTQSIEVLGRRNYEDAFVDDMTAGGRIKLASGEKAHMSSLDIVPQMFATMMSEGLQRFAVQRPLDQWEGIKAANLEREVIAEYLSKQLFGVGTHMVKTGATTVKDMSAREVLLNKMNDLHPHEILGRLQGLIAGDQIGNGGLIRRLMSQRMDLMGVDEGRNINLEAAYQKVLNETQAYGLYLDGNTQSSLFTLPSSKEEGVDRIINAFKDVIHAAPELINEVVRYGFNENSANLEIQAYKEYVNGMFDPFLQSREERTYGGQQGFFRTVLLGLSGNSSNDEITAKMMRDLDVDNQTMDNLNAYARYQALNYNTTSDLKEYMYRSIASKSTSTPSGNSKMDSLLFAQEARQIGEATNLGILESIGIGTKLTADQYIVGNNGQIDLAASIENVLKSMGEDDVTEAVREQVRKNLVKSFTSQDSFNASIENGELVTKNNALLQFYTGGKLTQLPQRIKNAMGARPLMQFSMEAQRAIEDTFAAGEEKYTIQQLTNKYLSSNRTQLESLVERRVKSLTAGRSFEEMKRSNNAHQTLNDFEILERLQVISRDMFRDSSYGLGAIFKGNIKRILSQQQLEHVKRKREELEALFGNEEKDQALLNEVLRIELIKDSINNSGLGHMVAGHDKFRYTMSFIQLNGVYTDSFLANPLYGTIYKDDTESYSGLKLSGDMANGVTEDLISKGYVLNEGMREGYFETQAKSIKSSMIGEGGPEFLLKQGDRVVEITEKGTLKAGSTGRFIVQRHDGKEWKPVMVDGQPLLLDEKRNVIAIGNVLDNTSFSGVGTPSLGASKLTNYGRVGEQSEDYIFATDLRQGNFSTNEYVQFLHRLRSKKPGGGSRVEGTNTSALIKGVANFAGSAKYRYYDRQAGAPVEIAMGYFQALETQIYERLGLENKGEEALGGSLAFMARNIDRGRSFGFQTESGFAPLSSMVHGLYNVNNFKSFFWSHGAAIITDRVIANEVPTTSTKVHTLLDNLLAGGSIGRNQVMDNTIIAKRMMGGLMMAFGDQFITIDGTANIEDRNTNQNIKKLKRAFVEAMERGEYGETYRSMAVAQRLLLGSSSRLDLSANENSHEIMQEKLYADIYDKVKTESVFNDLNLGALSMITADEALRVMSGDVGAAESLIGKVRGMLTTAADKAKANGGSVTLGGADGFMNRQAIHVATAIDLFQQMSSQNKSFAISSEVDIVNSNVRDILMGISGTTNSLSDSEKQALMEMIEGASTQINMVSVFVDPTFSQSKDPVSTQTVARHEAQHLVTPYLGDIQQFKEGGQMDKIRHTLASLLALSTGTKHSGLRYGDKLQAMAFDQSQAYDLRGMDAEYLMSSFQGQRFLGFYQGGALDAYTRDYIAEYKRINYTLMTGGTSGTGKNKTVWFEDSKFTAAGEGDVRDYVTNMLGFKGDRAEAEVHRLLNSSYETYAFEKLQSIEYELARINDRFQSNSRQAIGTNTKTFLEGMSNQTMFFSMPKISFDYQSGAIVARATNVDMFTFLPSASMMRELGAQHQDFIDPVMNNYKVLSQLFTPGHIANKAFQKVMSGMSMNEPVVLTNSEARALQEVMEAADKMPDDIEDVLGSQRVQQASGGKTKYQGFTSIGIGSLLMPTGSVALPQAKLDEVGRGQIDKRRLDLIEVLESSVDRNTVKYHAPELDKVETLLVKFSELDYGGKEVGIRGRIASLAEYGKFAESGEPILSQAGKSALSAYNAFHKMRKASIYARSEGVSTDKRITTIVRMLNNLDYAYDQIGRMNTDKSKLKDISKLRDEVDNVRRELLQAAKDEFGLKVMSQEEHVERLLYRDVANRLEIDYDLDRAVGISDIDFIRSVQEDYGIDVESYIEESEGLDKGRKSISPTYFIFDKSGKAKVIQDSTGRSGPNLEPKSKIDETTLMLEKKAKEIYKGSKNPSNKAMALYLRGYKYDPSTGVALDGLQRKFEVNDMKFIRRMEREAINMVAAGVSKKGKEDFKTLQQQSIKLNELMNRYTQQIKSLDKDGAYAAYKDTYKLLRSAEKQIQKLKSVSPDPNDRYIYTMAEANINALRAELRLATYAQVGTANKDVATQYMRRMERFSNLASFLNQEGVDGYNLFRGLGLSQSEIGIDDVKGPVRGAIGSTIMEDSEHNLTIINQLKGIDKLYANKELGLDKKGKGRHKKQMAQEHITEMIGVYQKQLKTLTDISKARNGKILTGREINGENNFNDEYEKARILAAHADQTERLETLIKGLEDLRSEFKDTTTDYEIKFRKVNQLVKIYDTQNADSVEFFRSPTAGGTDPRLHTYRAMEGVSAFNRVVMAMNEEFGVASGGREKLLLDVERNATATYIGAVGIVTYGGGDFDGDPYTTIFHQAAQLNSEFINARGAQNLAYHKKQALLEALKTEKDPTKQEEIKKALAGAEEAYKIANEKYKMSGDRYTEFSKYGSNNITARARKQVANFLGMDERHFISVDGEAILNPDGSVKEYITGFADKTMQADAMHALLNTGYGLYEGIGNAGPKLMNLYRNIDAIVGFAGADDNRQALEFLTNLGKNIKLDTKGNPVGNPVNILREQLQRRLEIRTDVDSDEYNWLKSNLNASDDELRPLAYMLGQMGIEAEAAARMQIIDLESKEATANIKRQGFLAQFIGGSIYGSIEANSKMQKLMKLGSNDINVKQSTFDLLTQSLGKAGGEILGKAYNTIIGTTFKDAPVISLGRALEDENFRQIAQNAYAESIEKTQGGEITAEVLKLAKERGIDPNNAEAMADLRKGVLDERVTEFASIAKSAMEKSEAVQGFTKNIHQILRDSIKLKSDGKEQIKMLKAKSAEYDQASDKITELNKQIADTTDRETLNRLKQERRDLIEQRGGLIEDIASNLGPGAGLKSLMNLDQLIKSSAQGGLTRKQYAQITGGGLSSGRAQHLMDSLEMDQAQRAEVASTKGSDYSKQLGKMARLATTRDIASMVTSYRFENRMDQGISNISNVSDFALQHKRRLAAEADAGNEDIDASLRAQKEFIRLGNSTANGQVAEVNRSVTTLLTQRYLSNNNETRNGIANSAYREALALHLGLDMDKFYGQGGAFDDDAKIFGQSIADIKENGINEDLEKQLLVFDAMYRDSAETMHTFFGADGARLEEFSAMEHVRTSLAMSMGGNDNARQTLAESPMAQSTLFKNLDTEVITQMGQLITQNKLGADGADVFAMMYRGVVSSLLEGTETGFSIVRDADKFTEEQKARGRELDDGTGRYTVDLSFNELSSKEKKRETARAVARAMAGTDPQSSGRDTSEDAKNLSAVHAAMLDNDKYFEAYESKMEGTLTREERRLLAEMGDNLLIQTMEEGGERWEKLIDTFIPGKDDSRYSANGGPDSTRAAYVTNIKKVVNHKKYMREIHDQQQQLSRREAVLKANPILQRGSFMNQLSTGAASLLATNKVSNSLDLLVPLALTAFGQAISEGSVDDDSLQRLGGTALSAFNYARAGMIDDRSINGVTGKDVRAAQATIRGLTGVYKFRNALNRHDGNYAMAAVDTMVYEGTGLVMNHMLAPKFNHLLANRVFGAGQGPGLHALKMDKYIASQQMAGNIGSSIISAASTAIISGILMRNVVEPAISKTAMIQSFQPATDYQAQANAEISRIRAQEAAYEMSLALETDSTESEISDYKMDTDSTFGDYNQEAIADLQNEQDIEPDSLGNLALDIMQ